MFIVTRPKEQIKRIEQDIPSGSTRDDLQDFEIDEKQDSFESGTHYGRRDGLYTDLMSFYLETSREKAKKNSHYKCWFFCLTMLIILVLTGGPIAVFVILALKTEVGAGDISLVAGSTVGMLTSVIVLPKIIAEHLFPTNEAEYMIEMVKNMQENDSKIREAHVRRPLHSPERDEDEAIQKPVEESNDNTL